MKCRLNLQQNNPVDQIIATLKHCVIPVMSFWTYRPVMRIFFYPFLQLCSCSWHRNVINSGIIQACSCCIHTCQNLYFCVLLSAFHFSKWAVYETNTFTHTHIYLYINIYIYAGMQMCLLAMNKLSVLICSLQPGDKSDHGGGGFSPASAPHHLWIMAAGLAEVQVAPAGLGEKPVQSLDCRCCSRSNSVSPKRPRCHETRHFTTGVTLKPAEGDGEHKHDSMLEMWVEVAAELWLSDWCQCIQITGLTICQGCSSGLRFGSPSVSYACH